ncbi:MAG: hypothetical protein OXI23_09695 [Gemmatimonadota bacterium]|nr:hypothetical protein [Gemmatimonadota bacterium]
MIRFIVEAKGVDRQLLHLKSTSKAPVGLFKRIHAHQQAMSGLMFRNLRHGGTYRGVRWGGFADQYTRKTDGVTVPAEGGVERLDGRGQVLGHLRPSGARVGARSHLLRDTGVLANAVASVHRIRNGGRTLEIITPLKYAGAQQAHRPFTFFTDADARLYTRWAARELLR